MDSKPRKSLEPVSTGNPAIDATINTELAFYNRTGNMLALWAVLAICVQQGIKLPPDVGFKFAQIAERLLKYSKEEVVGARDLVADDVLGTKNESGGRSVFQNYATHKRNTPVINRVRALLMQDVEDLQNHSITSAQKRPQSRIYEQVAAEHSLEPETVKRLFEEDDHEAGAFGYRVLRKKPNADGIVEV